MCITNEFLNLPAEFELYFLGIESRDFVRVFTGRVQRLPHKTLVWSSTPPHFPGSYGTFKKGEMLEALSKPTRRRIVMMDAMKKN